MARFRTQLATDQTTLAWTGTTPTMATFGFGTVGSFRARSERSSTPLAIHPGVRSDFPSADIATAAPQ